MQRAQSPQLLGHVRSMVTLPNDNQISGDVDQQGGRRKLELDREAQGVVSRSPNAVSSPPLFIPPVYLTIIIYHKKNIIIKINFYLILP